MSSVFCVCFLSSVDKNVYLIGEYLYWDVLLNLVHVCLQEMLIPETDEDWNDEGVDLRYVL